MDVTLDINGEPCTVTVSATTTLLEVLRDDLRLTGAKRGCNYGVCGACSVLFDGQPARACLALAADCTGRAITTIEGIAPPGEIAPLQQAMLDAGAVQCGFCTPAMVLAAKALLEVNPDPDETAIRTALGGNLCRCTGYTAIVAAIQQVARG